MHNQYPAFKVSRLNGHSSYYLFASPKDCVEFVEERQAGNEFGFLIRTLKSRTVVKQREAYSQHIPKEQWFSEVQASMLAHLDCAMEMVNLAADVRMVKAKPTLQDYAHVAADSARSFDQTKRRLAMGLLLQDVGGRGNLLTGLGFNPSPSAV